VSKAVTAACPAIVLAPLHHSRRACEFLSWRTGGALKPSYSPGPPEDESLMPAAYSIIGILLNLVGVILLFRYGMPYRVRTQGYTARVIMPPDEGAKALEVWWGNLGLLGLLSIGTGTVFQVIGAVIH
jgi:hypothetical protein